MLANPVTSLIRPRTSDCYAQHMRASYVAFPAVAILLYAACSPNDSAPCDGDDYLFEGCGVGTVVCTDGETFPVVPLYSGPRCTDGTEPAGSASATSPTVSCVLTAKCPDGTTETRTLSWTSDKDGCPRIPFALFGYSTIYVCANSQAPDAALDVSASDVVTIDATFDSSSDGSLDAPDGAD